MIFKVLFSSSTNSPYSPQRGDLSGGGWVVRGYSFSVNVSRVDALIRGWTLINFRTKFQHGRLFQSGR